MPDRSKHLLLIRPQTCIILHYFEHKVVHVSEPPSKPREFHPQLLTDPDLSLSTYSARVSTLDKHSSRQKAVATFGILFEANRRT